MASNYSQTLKLIIFSLTRRLQATETRTGPLPYSGRIIVEKSSQLVISGEMSQSLDLEDWGESLLYTNSAGMIKIMYDLCKRMLAYFPPT